MNMAQHKQKSTTTINGHGDQNPFLIPFLITLVFAFIELVGGLLTESLALFSDACHMFSDVVALAIAMGASHQAGKKQQKGDSKEELIASVMNALIMLFVIAWIVYEAVERIASPRPTLGSYVIFIAFIGLAVNLFVAKNLHQHEGEKGLNHQAAFLHVIGDILGSIAALVAGLVIHFTGWLPIDPILSIFISLLLLLTTLNLIKNIWRGFHGDESTHHH